MNDKFHRTGESASKPGKYTVRLSGTDPDDKFTNKSVTEETPTENYCTAKVVSDDLNVKSKIEFEVVKGKKNVFDYDIIASNFKPVRIN